MYQWRRGQPLRPRLSADDQRRPAYTVDFDDVTSSRKAAYENGGSPTGGDGQQVWRGDAEQDAMPVTIPRDDRKLDRHVDRRRHDQRIHGIAAADGENRR